MCALHCITLSVFFLEVASFDVFPMRALYCVWVQSIVSRLNEAISLVFFLSNVFPLVLEIE